MSKPTQSHPNKLLTEYKESLSFIQKHSDKKERNCTLGKFLKEYLSETGKTVAIEHIESNLRSTGAISPSLIDLVTHVSLLHRSVSSALKQNRLDYALEAIDTATEALIVRKNPTALRPSTKLFNFTKPTSSPFFL